MLRALILATLLLAATGRIAPAGAGLPEDAAPLTPASPVAPATARGALVWLHGSYDAATDPRPADPDWLAPLLARGYDLWHFDRPTRPDPLAEGGARLLHGLAALRHGGYRRIVVAGFSRGAFIALPALARPDLADAVAAISPAAHGRREDRKPAALAAFAEPLRAAQAIRFAFVMLRDDPWDPGPDARAAMARQSAPGRAGLLLLLDRPAGIEGHMGSFDPAFTRRFAACLAAFLDATAGPDACAGR